MIYKKKTYRNSVIYLGRFSLTLYYTQWNIYQKKGPLVQLRFPQNIVLESAI